LEAEALEIGASIFFPHCWINFQWLLSSKAKPFKIICCTEPVTQRERGKNPKICFIFKKGYCLLEAGGFDFF